MRKLALPLGVLVVVLAAGVVLLILPGKSKAPTTTEAYTDLITVNSPIPNAKVVSPLVITGKARGGWYFEASFPVELLSAAGLVVAQAPAQAQGEWMTSEFVPFSATLTFAKQPAGSHGTLLLKKDNPSGDPARDDSISIPVVFQ